MGNTIVIDTFQTVPQCSKCGSDDLRMPEGITKQDDLADDSLITCANCGTVTTYAALVESREADVVKSVKDTFGGLCGGPLD